MLERRLSYLKIDTNGHVHVKVPRGLMDKISAVASAENFRETINDNYKKDHAKQSLAGDLDSIAWFLYIINILPQSKKKYSSMTMIPLSAEVLKTWLTSRYSNYINFLELNNFIEIDHNYVIGKRCKLYSIRHEDKELVPYIIKDKFLVRRLYTEFKRKRDEITNQLKSKVGEEGFDKLKQKKEYFDSIMHFISIDSNKAEEIIDKSDVSDQAKYMEKIRVNDIKNCNFYSSFDKNGRFHTNFTQISKKVRNTCLTFKGEKISEIDIVSCQPQMLYLLMKDLYNNVNSVIKTEGNLTREELGDYNPNDCRLNYIANKNKIGFSIVIAENSRTRFSEYNHYGFDCLQSFNSQLEKDLRLFGNILKQDSGTDIYKIFCEALKQKGLSVTRDQMKKAFLSFLFSDDSKYENFTPIRNIWKKQFPAMYSVLVHDKIGDHTSIANKLQYKESEFIYNTLMPELKENKIDFFTVHDCVFVADSKAEKAYNIFKNVALNYGLVSGVTLKKCS